MINLELITQDLYEQLVQRFPHIDIRLEKPGANESIITLINPHKGHPVNIFINNFDEEIKVVYYKTARFFPITTDGIDFLLKSVEDYLNGQIVYLNIISPNNKVSSRERIVPVSELPENDLQKLTQLCREKNLLNESDLLFELQSGSSVAVNFWDISKNFCYKMKGKNLIKVSS